MKTTFITRTSTKSHSTNTTNAGAAGAYAPSINSHSEQVIHREFTLDYLSPLTDVIMEKETGSGGLSYRFVAGLSVEQVVVSGLCDGSGTRACLAPLSRRSIGSIRALHRQNTREGTKHSLRFFLA